MSNVIPFPQKDLDNGEYMQGHAVCTRCAGEWVAIAPLGAHTGLECPHCGLFCGQFVGEVAPPEAWECNCGGQLFYLTPVGAPTCCNCGLRATSWSQI